MKTIEELKKVRSESISKVIMRTHHSGYRIYVDMGTYGLTHGARDVVKAFLDIVAESDIRNAVVIQKGCNHEIDKQVVVEIIDNEGHSEVYQKVTPAIVREIFESHVINHRPVTKYLLEV